MSGTFKTWQAMTPQEQKDWESARRICAPETPVSDNLKRAIGAIALLGRMGFRYNDYD